MTTDKWTHLTRRDFLINTAGLIIICTVENLFANEPNDSFSETGVLLVQDLTADRSNALRARNIISIMAEQCPEDLYHILTSVDSFSRQRYKLSFSRVDPRSRHTIIDAVYKNNTRLKKICTKLIKLYYNEAYKWVILGYKSVAHVFFKYPDPEFSDYDQPCTPLEAS